MTLTTTNITATSDSEVSQYMTSHILYELNDLRHCRVSGVARQATVFHRFVYGISAVTRPLFRTADKVPQQVGWRDAVGVEPLPYVAPPAFWRAELYRSGGNAGEVPAAAAPNHKTLDARSPLSGGEEG